MKARIGNKLVGDNEPCFIEADIGINHNGSILNALELIRHAKKAGCDAVKFQKRTVDAVYTPEELSKPRSSPFGVTSGDLKWGLELGLEDYEYIDQLCAELGIMWFASCWDEESVEFMEGFDPPCHKVASPMLTNIPFLECLKETGRSIILSTGMSTLKEIDGAVKVLGQENLVILHCTSTYPCAIEELNLHAIQTLVSIYDCPIGYSGHEIGIATTVAAVALGAKFIERHITLDRAMWGTDQAASVEPLGIERLVKYIHATEKALGDGIKRVYETEIPIMEKLRRG